MNFSLREAQEFGSADCHKVFHCVLNCAIFERSDLPNNNIGLSLSSSFVILEISVRSILINVLCDVP